MIRDAAPADAAAACAVVRASITELCADDHGNDPAILARWLANKTPAEFLRWLRPGNSVLVAVEGARVVGVGAVTDAGHITLNYVAPSARFRGVSRAMLGALERRAAARGNAECTLSSTQTARRFYLSAGYTDQAQPELLFGTASGYPMAKRLG